MKPRHRLFDGLQKLQAVRVIAVDRLALEMPASGLRNSRITQVPQVTTHCCQTEFAWHYDERATCKLRKKTVSAVDFMSKDFIIL